MCRGDGGGVVHQIKKIRKKNFSETFRDTCILIRLSGSLTKALKKLLLCIIPSLKDMAGLSNMRTMQKGGGVDRDGGGVDQFKFNHIYTLGDMNILLG